MADSRVRYKFIIFGGTGFIGRNLVHFLIENNVASYIRVVDKVPPQVAWLNKTHKETFNDPKIEFRSSNLINPVSCAASCDGEEFDFAINCAGETKLGQTDPVYHEGILKVSLNCATASRDHGIGCYVEISSGQMFSDEKTPHKENDKVEPWTSIAKHKLEVEKEIKSINGLNYIVVRPAIVYGFGDRTGLVPRLVIGGLYHYMGEKMKVLWGNELVMNTVHVEDLCRAIWHLASRKDSFGQVFNVVDDGKTTQGSLSNTVASIFNIGLDVWGHTMTSLCMTDIESLVEEVNEKHLWPWAEVCNKDGVVNSPLSPYIHQELLSNKHLHLDSSKLLNTDFHVKYPKPTKELLLEIINDYIEMGLFPKSLLP